MLKRLKHLQERCNVACEKVGRDPVTVRIVAVSKGQPLELIEEAYHLGVRDFGENYAAEMAQKMDALASKCADIRWHYIGHIQSNKIRLIGRANWIHGLSEANHAKLLSALSCQFLMQVNLGGEEQRSGVALAYAKERFVALRENLGSKLCGLMTIAPQSKDARHWFAKMADLRRELEAQLLEEIPELSMGMSGDFEEAIAYGATWIRVGTALFGERQVRPKH